MTPTWILIAMAILAPFGAWESPVTSDLIAAKAIHFRELHTDGEYLYWLELRPAQNGKTILVKMASDGTITEPLGDVSVQTRVHEYGGGALSVVKERLFYSDDGQRKLCTFPEKLPLAGSKDYRFADGTIAAGGDKIILVAEKHQPGGSVENFLVALDMKGTEKVVASGHDFYAAPRLSPDGKELAFLTWDFPNMPWDGTTLWLGEIDEEGNLHNKRAIAGGADESICQVAWSPKGELYFVSDRTGWGNLYRYREGECQPLCLMEAECGYPAWVFGKRTYDFMELNGKEKLLTIYTEKGFDRLGLLEIEDHIFTPLDLPFTALSDLTVLNGKAYFFGASTTEPLSIIVLDLETKEYEPVRKSFQFDFDEKWISEAQLIEFSSKDGETGYAYYYPPKNPNFVASDGEKPPLLVKCHGGPSARSMAYLNLEVQYWTTRGFAVLDVNYGGSTGFGREYLKRLEGNWGVLDVDDCMDAAREVTHRGLADENRLFIKGGSAGGYTVLCALTFHDFFAGGTSYYGVSDLKLLYEDTHKFESQYTDRLVGPYPEAEELINERSPINHVEKINAPVLLLQGEEDKIVLPNQTLVIFEALKAKGTPVGMILFEGEGHGFRSGANVKRALDAEYYFYCKILGLTPPEDVEPVEIENL
jgi:dipeptidyl aminopeptidase/acylaminoacyl peptidase